MGRLSDLEGLSHCYCGRPLQPDDGIYCKACEVVMADKPEKDEVKSMQDALASRAADVQRAARKVSPLIERLKAMPGAPADMDVMQDEVADMDGKFSELERNMNALNLDDVRVLKYDRDGRMTDVTDKVRPQDLRPENIKGFTADKGVTIPRNPDGSVDREAALSMLSALFTEGKNRRRFTPEEKQAVASERAMREMEVVLDIADKTLEHWRK